MKLIVVLSPEERFDTIFDGARRRSWAHPGHSFNFDLAAGHQVSKATIYEVEDDDATAAINRITEWHQGKEICVADIKQLFQRMPGPLVEKKITASGKLPI